MPTTYVLNASAPKPYFILRTPWNNVEARNSFTSRRKRQGQRKGQRQAHLLPMKIPMTR